MSKLQVSISKLKLFWLLAVVSLLLLTAAQCQPVPPPSPVPSPTSPPPTPLLIPPIPHGDGSDLLDRLLDSGVIRVGLHVWPEANFSPPAFRGFSNARTGGALNGFEVDLAHQLADGLGLELELVEAYPPVIATGDWRNQWDIALASLVPFDHPPESAKANLVYSKPYGYMPVGVLIPADNTTIRGLGDLSGRRVGVLAHSVYQRLLTPGKAGLTIQQQRLIPPAPARMQVIPAGNLPKAIRGLGQPAGNIEAIFGPTPILAEAIKSELPVKLAPQATRLGVIPLAVAAVPPDNLKVDRLMLEINKILDRLQRQGTLSEIYLRWYQQDLSQKTDK